MLHSIDFCLPFVAPIVRLHITDSFVSIDNIDLYIMILCNNNTVFCDNNNILQIIF